MTTTPKDDKGFEDWLPFEAVYLGPGEYKIVDKDGHSLFYVEGNAFSQWLVKTLNQGQAKDEEIGRLKRGDFTPEEFQNLCHSKLPEDCTADSFCDGCEGYQTH
jgi:hypothetical protein